MRPNCSNSTGIIVTSAFSANGLGVVRGFGRRGIPVVYIYNRPERGDIVRYSKYIHERLIGPSPTESNAELVNVLLNFGKQIDSKMVIIPTDDRHVLSLSKHKQELEQFFFLPVPSHEIVQKLVNKRSFYKLLLEMQIPHPKTYFPEDITELWSMGREIDYPYIIKPANSMLFREEFDRKCFVIDSAEELDRAIERLREKNLELVIQEIIPGRVVYEFYTYFNRQSEPLAICGWDKIRHYPPDFGSGSFCKSVWRSSAIEQGISFLKAIGYHGIAGIEMMKDPIDSKYKMIEVNARTTTQNRLAAACGVDVEYIAYLDANGQYRGDSASPCDNVFWVEDFLDLVSCLVYLKRKEITIGEIVDSLRVRKVHSVVAWDDPAPLIPYVISLGFGALHKYSSKPRRALGNLLGERWQTSASL